MYAIERYFSVDIPDPVCEKLYTVGDVAGYIGQRLGVVGQRRSAARDAVRQQVSTFLELPSDILAEGNPSTVGQLLPDAAAVARFRQLAISCGLVPPELSDKGRVRLAGFSFCEQLLGLTPLPPPIPWPARPLATSVDWIVAASYAQLPQPPASECEVERAIVGITSKCSGVPAEDIPLASSFVYDLGMN